MKPRLRISRGSRLRLALLATFALLMQQLAFAAHACMVFDAPATMAAHCEGMQMPPSGDNALCGQHCTQPVSNATDVRTPTVPPAMLPALFPSAPALLPLALASPPSRDRAAPHPSPPATIAFCTLQI